LICHNIVDPFEDTESLDGVAKLASSSESHNIVDPFEDTERRAPRWTADLRRDVTTSSIRSRILKANATERGCTANDSHNIVDPFEDTESTTVMPITSLCADSHNIVDPFEDTERGRAEDRRPSGQPSQHRRSVRGY